MYQTSLVQDSYSSSFSFADPKLSTERNNECRVTSTFHFAEPSKTFWQFCKMLSPATLLILFWFRSASGRKGDVKPLHIIFYVFFKARTDSPKSLCSRVFSTWKLDIVLTARNILNFGRSFPRTLAINVFLIDWLTGWLVDLPIDRFNDRCTDYSIDCMADWNDGPWLIDESLIDRITDTFGAQR